MLYFILIATATPNICLTLILLIVCSVLEDRLAAYVSDL